MTDKDKSQLTGFCKHPDRDVPGLVCGHPMPCPYHTIIVDVESKQITIPEAMQKKVKPKTIRRLKRIAKTIDKKRRKVAT